MLFDYNITLLPDHRVMTLINYLYKYIFASESCSNKSNTDLRIKHVKYLLNILFNYY